MIKLTNVTKHYYAHRREIRALGGVSLTIGQGEFLAITGASGSGKSTLMNILGCLDFPETGEYLLEGQDVSTLSDGKLSEIRNHKIGFIFQGFNLIATLTALENVELPLTYRKKKASKKKRQEIAVQALESVGLSHRMLHKPAELSGGQQQRVAIARAIAATPPIILADEPTGNLDERVGGEILQLLQGLSFRGHTIIMITHDKRVAACADRCVEIQSGYLVSGA